MPKPSPRTMIAWIPILALTVLAFPLAAASGAKVVGKEDTAPPLPVRLECGPDSVTFRLGPKAVVTYRGGRGVLPAGVPEEYRRAGYLHPLVTPEGAVVSADYPKNHLHHHGVWTSWTKTRFDGRSPDFWNMGQKKGRVEMVGWLGAREAAEGAEIEVLHRYVDLTATMPTTVLMEGWKIRVPATPSGKPHRIDLMVRQTNVTDHPLVLPQYHYGGLGYRGLDADNQLGPWQDRWETSEMLPLQVKVEVEAVHGGRWPDLVVTLARSEGGAGGGLLPGGANPVLP